MSNKTEYELSQNVEKISLIKISMKVMSIWRQTEEGTDLYNEIKELIDLIEKEQIKIDDYRGLLYVMASKL